METSSDEHCFSIGMLLLPGFNGLAAHAMIDPFRAANYLHGKPVYHWKWLSLDREPVIASNGLKISNTRCYSDCADKLDYVVINASWSPENYRSPALAGWLRKQASMGSILVAIDTGAFLLGYAGLIKGYRVTVHYEHIAAFRELFRDTVVSDTLYILDRDRLSCCGGQASADLGLEILYSNHGLDLANGAARYIFHERLRPQTEGQLSRKHEPVGHSIPPNLLDAIVLMERNLEEPLSLPEIARHAGLSSRQLERVFRIYTGMTPIRYYVDVRLDRARGLVTQTEMTMVEIASACGFRSAAHFSRAYKKRFTLAPMKDRFQGRIPFHFRSFPSHAGLS